MFSIFDAILIIEFFKIINASCDTNGEHETAAMWLSQLLLYKTVSSVGNARPRGKRTSQISCQSASEFYKIFYYLQPIIRLSTGQKWNRRCLREKKTQHHALWATRKTDAVPLWWRTCDKNIPLYRSNQLSRSQPNSHRRSGSLNPAQYVQEL